MLCKKCESIWRWAGLGWITKKIQVAELFGVDERTVERYISSHGDELEKNGYRLLKGNILKKLKSDSLTDINVGQSLLHSSLFLISKIPFQFQKRKNKIAHTITKTTRKTRAKL